MEKSQAKVIHLARDSIEENLRDTVLYNPIIDLHKGRDGPNDTDEVVPYCPITIGSKQRDGPEVQVDGVPDPEPYCPIFIENNDRQPYSPFDIVEDEKNGKNIEGSLSTNRCQISRNMPGPGLALRTVNTDEERVIDFQVDYYSSEKSELLVKQEGSDVFTKLCNFVPQLLEIRNYIDTSDSELKYLIRLNFNDGYSETEISTEDFKKSGWIEAAAPMKAILSPIKNVYKMIKDFIILQSSTAQTVDKFQFVGWLYRGGKHVYLHGNGCIGSDEIGLHGKPELVLEYDLRHSRKFCFDAAATVVNASEDRFVTGTYFSFLHAGFLTELFSEAGYPIREGLFLYGKTNSGKTTLACTLSVWNRTKAILNPESNFYSTGTSLEKNLSLYKDSLQLIDDVFSTSTRAKASELAQKVETIVRYIGDSAGRGRCDNKLNSLNTYPPRGLVVMTGEGLPKGESTVSRLISLNLKKESIDSEFLDYHKHNPKVLGTHFYYFIDWIAANYDEIVRFISENFHPRRKVYKEMKVGRTRDALITLDLTAMIFGKYASDCQLLAESDVEWFVRDLIGLNYQALSVHYEMFKEENPCYMFLNAIQEGELVGKIHFRPRGNFEGIYKGNHIGFEDEDYLYLIPDATMSFLTSHYRALNRFYPLGKDATLEALAYENLILYEQKEDKKSGKVITNRTLNRQFKGYGRNRYIVVKKQEMQSYLGLTKEV